MRCPPLLLPCALLAATLALLLGLVVLSYRLYDDNKRIDTNTALLQTQQTRLDRTVKAFCEADSHVVRFWTDIRQSIIVSLDDPRQTPEERRANEEFRQSLTLVIDSFKAVGKNC